ncbi:hypothetical protein RB195_004318 [Necator americanus]|uniref:Uncharacterized protein n=1 Tax=Necator americanus TaxID=51031 RepID=A0ABR1BHE5_NECAM
MALRGIEASFSLLTSLASSIDSNIQCTMTVKLCVFTFYTVGGLRCAGVNPNGIRCGGSVTFTRYATTFLLYRAALLRQRKKRSLAVFSKAMGGSASRPLRCAHGCWTLKSHDADDDVYKAKKAGKLPRSKIKKIQLSRQELHAFQWEEIPTPSVCDREMPIIEGPPSQEKLIQIINCFPFPTPRSTPHTTPMVICMLEFHWNSVQTAVFHVSTFARETTYVPCQTKSNQQLRQS